MALEIVSQDIKYEAFLHWVGDEPRDIREDYRQSQNPGIEAVNEIANSQWGINHLAWVDLSKRARVIVEHDNDPPVNLYDTKPYGQPNYPLETILGQRMIYGPTWLVTDRNGTELEFTSVEDVIRQGELSAYAQRWARLIRKGNQFPGFFSQISSLIRGSDESDEQPF